MAKTDARGRHWAILAGAVGIVAWALIGAGAAVDDPPVPDGEFVTSIADGPRVDMDFPGGSVEEFYDHLREQVGFNIVYQLDAAQQRHESVQMKRIRLQEAVMLPVLLADDVRVLAHDSYVQVWTRPQEATPKPTRFDLSFEGGSLEALAESIRDVSPGANIVVMPSARDFEVPAFRLRDVTAIEVFRVLDLYMPTESARLSIHVVEPESNEAVDGDRRPQPLIRVELQQIEQPEVTLQNSVWSTASLETRFGVTTEMLHSAVDAALELADSEARVQYHPEAKLLIARGTSDDMLLIDTVLGRLQASSAHLPDRDDE